MLRRSRIWPAQQNRIDNARRERNNLVKDDNSTPLLVRNRNLDVVNIETPMPVTVAVVEDDERFREALVFQLLTARFQVAAHASAESFLESPHCLEYDCIIADICLPGMNGLQLLAEVKGSVASVSIIFVTGCGDLSTGVQAMREGAIDCLEKPIDDQTLINSIRSAADLSRMRRAEDLQRFDLQQRELTLTPREHEVFILITNGLLNKQVGATLGATERTIKTHRGRVMNKMRADSLADLVRMAEVLKVHPFSHPAFIHSHDAHCYKGPSVSTDSFAERGLRSIHLGLRASQPAISAVPPLQKTPYRR